MDTDIYRVARLAYRLGRQDQQRILEHRLRKQDTGEALADQIHDLAVGMTDELVDFHVILRAAEEGSTSSEAVNSGDVVNTRHIPPGHIGITDPPAQSVHEQWSCPEHGPTVAVLWTAGMRCPLCEAYDHERALKLALERHLCQHIGCNSVETHAGCHARAVLDRLYGGYLPSTREK